MILGEMLIIFYVTLHSNVLVHPGSCVRCIKSVVLLAVLNSQTLSFPFTWNPEISLHIVFPINANGAGNSIDCNQFDGLWHLINR
jgi:hypothetical protein